MKRGLCTNEDQNEGCNKRKRQKITRSGPTMESNQITKDSKGRIASENVFTYRNFTNSKSRRELLKDALLKKINITSGVSYNSSQSFVWKLIPELDVKDKEKQYVPNIAEDYNNNTFGNEMKSSIINIYNTNSLNKSDTDTCNHAETHNGKMNISFITSDESVASFPNTFIF